MLVNNGKLKDAPTASLFREIRDAVTLGTTMQDLILPYLLNACGWFEKVGSMPVNDHKLRNIRRMYDNMFNFLSNVIVSYGLFFSIGNLHPEDVARALCDPPERIKEFSVPDCAALVSPVMETDKDRLCFFIMHKIYPSIHGGDFYKTIAIKLFLLYIRDRMAFVTMMKQYASLLNEEGSNDQHSDCVDARWG